LGFKKVYKLRKNISLLIKKFLVDNKTTRHPLDEPARLAELTGMHVFFGKMRDFEGGDYGIAILSKLPILESKIFYYQKPSFLWTASSLFEPVR
jgi:hypothetical protein